ncbi:TetR/AcrR family transcriptional regulator [Amycolatopsis sp. QT-25]|uniref:TetR/AcrR family transcriptional regulator n=1 Tax=Amycolatopsis sp. QT-25 TaxID=3034022 RepID=UPI0023EAEE7B|nr:TetR/AcrR family transcriptional regulator [Amycolatopsis sp. QT-25]WET78041.1 TetR/AcrR family transcriptional regulator [Amycolatopsis sp. QT-25]
MPRPRVHDLERLLDAAEHLVVETGAHGVTVRSLAAAAGVSNGTIYHAFGSLGTLLAHVWLRAAGEFLDLQTTLADEVEDPVAAVVAAADTPAAFADLRPEAARLLITVKKEQVLGPQVPADLAADFLALDKRLITLLIALADRLWGRRDAQAVEVLTTCVVDLPTALFRRTLTAGEPISAASRARLAAAVRAILLLPPPRKD